ncbi:MAG: hypothetical protein ABEJ43_04235 [Haloferacaceae archaeon]
MEWEQTRGDDESADAVGEWTRSDGLATVRLRERADGSFVVRYDRLEQAAAGRAYRYERLPSREAAAELAAEWRGADGETESG